MIHSSDVGLSQFMISLKCYYAGYPSFRGQVLDGQQLWDLIEGLAANDLLFYTHLLTGGLMSFPSSNVFYFIV